MKSLSRYLVLISILLLFVSLISFRALERLELVGYDLALNLRTHLNPIDTHELPLVLIVIDDKTLATKGFRSFPLPRKYYAFLLTALKSWGAKQVAFDMLFSEPSDRDPDPNSNQDYQFARAISAFKDVLLPYSLTVDPRGYSRVVDIYTLFKNVLPRDRLLHTGYITTTVDIDGKRRYLKLRHLKVGVFKKEYLYHLSLVNVLYFLDVRPSEVINFPNRIRFVRIRPKQGTIARDIPLYRDDRFYLDYPGPWEKVFNKVSFASVLIAYGKQQRGIPLSEEEKRMVELIKGSSCIVGLTATGTQDLSPTPIERTTPMIETYGVVFASVLKDRFIRRMPVVLPALVFLLFGLVSIMRVRHLGIFWRNYLILALIWVGAALGLFVWSGMWFDYLGPLLGGFCMVLASSAYGYIDTVRERERVEQEMRVASEIQRQMLPTDIPQSETVKTEVFFSPAIFVAGDFYDVWLVKDRLRVLMGDVSGKGVSAALYVAQVITSERVLRPRFNERPVNELMEEVNRFLARYKISGVYATACMIEASRDKVVISDAGHLSAWMWRAEAGTLEEIIAGKGAPLGVDRWTEYQALDVAWSRGDSIILFSDGVLEARVGERFISEERVKEWVISNINAPVCSIDKLMQSFYGDQPQSDDITFVVIRNVGGEDGGSSSD